MVWSSFANRLLRATQSLAQAKRLAAHGTSDHAAMYATYALRLMTGWTVLRDSITEKEQVMGDVRRVQALLRSALAVVDEGHPDAAEADVKETTDATPTVAPPPSS